VLVGADRPLADPGGHRHRVGGPPDRPGQHPADHRRHPGVALERGQLGRIGPAHGNPVDEVADIALDDG
jgi:hypothetical protein